jgi:shikimate kinase
MMGAGKSTVGQLVADRLGWPYLDSDQEVQRNTGKTVPELFAEKGEAAFRAEERRALVEAVEGGNPVVVGVAGGAVLDQENRELLATSGLVVWLRADLDLLARRVGDGAGRPLLGDDPGEALARLYPQREPLYRELADVVVDVDELNPEEAADLIVASVG